MEIVHTRIRAIRWEDDGVVLLDQRRLPTEEVYFTCTSVDDVAEAIRTLAVRGAPLIGIAAAYGMVIAARQARDRAHLEALRVQLANTRPTAVNLCWALDRCRRVMETLPAQLPLSALAEALLVEARAIHDEDAAACAAMAQCGAALFPRNARVLTHCNTGALATGGIGTALGVIRAAFADGRVATVWVDETRPLLQGARLTAWELLRDNIPFKLICDNMAASLMAAGEVDVVITGADRITRSGDFANKIGTYGLAVLARAHQIPFYVAAPWSTVDLSLEGGAEIPVEFRHEDEVRCLADISLAPPDAVAWNPSFDVTPGHLVSGVITENGLVKFPLLPPNV